MSRFDRDMPETCPPFLSGSCNAPDAQQHQAAASVSEEEEDIDPTRRCSLYYNSTDDHDEPPLPLPPQFSPAVAAYILNTSLSPSLSVSTPRRQSCSDYASPLRSSPQPSPQPSQQSSQSSSRLPGDGIPFFRLELSNPLRRLYFRIRPAWKEDQNKHKHRYEQEKEQEQEHEDKDELAGPGYTLRSRRAIAAAGEPEPRRRVFTTYRAQRASHLRAIRDRCTRDSAASLQG